VLDLKDQALLLDPAGGGLDFGRHHGHGHHAGGTPPVTPNVSWLRKTEYISRDSSSSSHRLPAVDMFVPISPFLLPSNAQITLPFCLFSAERISRTMAWIYRARRSSLLSRVLSPRRAAQNNSLRCAIRPNRVCAPSQNTRYSQTQTYGRTRTTCSGLASGQASAGPRCGLLQLLQCRTTD
jgi:hypothetical protein